MQIRAIGVLYNPLGNGVANKFKYNGQESETTLGLNVTEMDFRQYDAAIGRFYNIDLLAEQATGISPYRFAYNNPIVFGDPSGLKEIQGEDPYIPPPTNPFTTGFNSYYGNTEHGFLWNLHNGGPFGQGTGNGGPAGYGFGTAYNGPYYENGYDAITNYGSYQSVGTGYWQLTGKYSTRIISVTGNYAEGSSMVNVVKDRFIEWIPNSHTQEAVPAILKAGYFDGTGEMTIGQQINTVIGVVGLHLAYTESILVKEAKVLAQRGTMTALSKIKMINTSLGKIGRISKTLGAFGAVTTTGTVAVDYFVNGKDLTYGQAADIAISIGLAALTISNPVALIGFGIYGVLDASGSLDRIKSSLGGDEVLYYNHLKNKD